MFEKKATFSLIEIEALNVPKFNDGLFVDQNLSLTPGILESTVKKIKTASKQANFTVDGDNTEFDLEAEIKSHPSSLYVKCFAIKADEPNDNGDYFSEEELKKSYGTFVGVPVFTNHNNTDAEQARGKVVHSWWDNDRNGIMIIARVDSEAYPQLARGIKENYIMSTSMGASRGHDLVSMADGSKKRVDELQVHDLVITHTGKTEAVFAICRTHLHDKLYHIKWVGNPTGLALSHEHPVLILKKNLVNTDPHRKSGDKDSIPAEFVEASKIEGGDYVLEFISNHQKSEKLKFDSFYYKKYIAHRVEEVICINNEELTYYVQIGENDDENSDHSYILNDIATHNCQVLYSLCSICHQKAETPENYCSHIKDRKTRKISAKKVTCQYHKSGGDGPCPICGCEEDDPSKFEVTDKQAFEYNYGIKFIENSFVVNPACHECGVTEVIDPQVFLSKAADIQRRLPILLKSASQTEIMCSDRGCIKLAGQKELDSLGQALDLITSVSQSMLSQKDMLDLEFLSDLVKVLADLQEVIDVLTQQGYGRLGENSTSTTETGEKVQNAVQTPSTPSPTPGRVSTGPAGEAGTVTSPLASKRLDMSKISGSVLFPTKTPEIENKIAQNTKNLLNLAFKISKKSK
jgi:hypothetical protein